MKTWYIVISFFATLMLAFSGTPVLAASTSGSFNDVADGNSSYSTQGVRGSYSGSRFGTGPYRSGPQRPSPGISPAPRSGGGIGSGLAPRPGFGTFFGGMAAGAIAGSVFHSMFHPFGYGYGGYGGYGGFGIGNLFGIILDAILIYIVFRIIRRLFFRSR